MVGAVAKGFNAVIEGFDRDSGSAEPTYGLCRLDVPKNTAVIYNGRNRLGLGWYAHDGFSLAWVGGDWRGNWQRVKTLDCCEGEAIVTGVGLRNDFYIGLSGRKNDKREEVADFAAHRFGLQRLRLRQVLEEDLKGQGIDITKDNLQRVGEEMRAAYGRDIVVKTILEKAAGTSIFDGVHDSAEAETINRLGGVVVHAGIREESKAEKLVAKSIGSWDGFRVVEVPGPDFSVNGFKPDFLIDTGYSGGVLHRGIEALFGYILHSAEIRYNPVQVSRPKMVVFADGRVFLEENELDIKDVKALPEKVGIAKRILHGENNTFSEAVVA